MPDRKAERCVSTHEGVQELAVARAVTQNISIHARNGHEPLVATFAGDRPEIDFIKDINPIGGDESTGVVTRFTIRAQPSPPGYPVCLRLLAESDVVKVLLNSYYQDGDQEYEAVQAPADLERHIAVFEGQAGQPGSAEGLTEADLWDIGDDIGRHAGGAASAAALEPLWDRLAALAPRLALDKRAALLSVAWSGWLVWTAAKAALALF